jgi:hypothetical protein
MFNYYPDSCPVLQRLTRLTSAETELDPDRAVVFPATNASATAKFFAGPRVLVRGCGENILLERPEVFANAVLEVAQLGSGHHEQTYP